MEDTRSFYDDLAGSYSASLSAHLLKQHNGDLRQRAIEHPGHDGENDDHDRTGHPGGAVKLHRQEEIALEDGAVGVLLQDHQPGLGGGELLQDLFAARPDGAAQGGRREPLLALARRAGQLAQRQEGPRTAPLGPQARAPAGGKGCLQGAPANGGGGTPRCFAEAGASVRQHG